jgi:predicted component of type VI protein secretion system
MYGSVPREARLTILTGQSEIGADFALRQSDQFLGRQPDCDVVIAHPTVSGRHARIFFADGNFFIEDLGSTNGTAVNHRAIAGPVVLRSGDIIQVGEVHLQFTDEIGATVVEAPAPAVFGSPSVDLGVTAVEPSPSAWATPPSFTGEERVSWGQPMAEGSAASPAETAAAPPAGSAAPAPGPAPADDASADAVAEARTVLTTLAARVIDLQRDVAAVTEAASRIETLLSEAERQRDEARGELARLRDGIENLAATIETQTRDLGIEGVLANLDGLVSSPNDLGLLVNVSRDAARYAALVRLTQDLSARLRALEG